MENVKSKTDSFIQMALRVDAEVATMVASSQEEFYQTNPWLRPPTPPSTWDTAGYTFSKCWNGVIEFCCSNIGKIIFGVLAVVVAIALVTYIISTCGLGLVPLLSAWGLSAGLATGISLGVAGITLASTAVAFIPNSLDLAAALDEVIDPENNPISDLNNRLHQHGWYNTTQRVANITSGIFGGFYSIGMMYNTFQAARIKGGSEANLFRKISNTGVYKDLAEPMQLRNVEQVANEAGIGLDGIQIKIVRDPDLIGSGFCGHASSNGKVIQLYPDAFTDTEALVKTLGHERMHIYQTNTFGPAIDSSTLKEFEKGAWGSEDSWWMYYNNGGK